MNSQDHVRQCPSAGSRRVMFRGDTARFTLELSEPLRGRAWIRTNIGHASLTRRAIMDAVEEDKPRLGTEWFDIPMTRMDSHHFTIALPLNETGHFEAKCFYMREGKTKPDWPPGENVSINVQPADTCCANIVYNAFVRQFGKNKAGGYLPDDQDADCIDRLDRKEYTVIPKSGTFRDLIANLDFIIGKLGCRYLHLLPISPTPTTYGRMGRFGSPYAALHFTGIDPALAVFDLQATPLEQFAELVDAVHARRAKLIIDVAVNHTGWAATLHETHPHWLLRDPKGDIHRPGAWGVTWADLTGLDYSQKGLWKYIARVFLTWCRRGVDGFRCDAGYMIPLPAWTYIIATVRQQFPDTLFLLEGLGGKISATRDLLNRANFNWAYSELFQNYDRPQIEHYLPEAIDISEKDGIAIHYAETHDNNRLASRSVTYAKMRTALCALSSQQGGFGFANGVEWFADIKINVHEAHPIRWGNPENQVDAIRRLNILLRSHPAFFEKVDLKFIQNSDTNTIAMLRHHLPSGKKLIVLVNLDDERASRVSWSLEADRANTSFTDLLAGSKVDTTFTEGSRSCELLPGQVLCLTTEENDLEIFSQPDNLAFVPDRLLIQRLKAKVMDVFCYYHGTSDMSDFDMMQATGQLVKDPVAFCRLMNPESDEHRVVFWQWPRDLNREVLLPPNHFLLVNAGRPFHASIVEGLEENERVISREESVPQGNENHFILFTPCENSPAAIHRMLKISIYEESENRHAASPLLFLTDALAQASHSLLTRAELLEGEHLFLSTNGIGGMCRADVKWGQLNSKYDALMAANLHPRHPDDRRILLARCRAWIVYQGYSQEVCFDNLHHFYSRRNRGIWTFTVPTGQGQSIHLTLALEMRRGENAVRLTFHRRPSRGDEGMLGDAEPVELILRPDIEDRNFHENTKAYLGAEKIWPDVTSLEPDGFVFAPGSDRTLTLRVRGGIFVGQPEWHYMVYRPVESQRGMDPHSDLWSPGYFSVFVNGDDTVGLEATVGDTPSATAKRPRFVFKPDAEIPRPFMESMQDALQSYLVKRDRLKTVIAGYPWFLDWGRDALIFSRCLIRTGQFREASDILKLFGGLEDHGTLPNMIHGLNTDNRDTSDAPLWFVVACADLIKTRQSPVFLNERNGRRTFREILISIGHYYINGTSHHVGMDSASGFIYSPAHFTWMDTNYPACTPRQGYCIEIQALWHAALVFLSEIDEEAQHNWKALARMVEESILDLFWLNQGYCADCLHASPGIGAKEAIPDDALRPNQLLAVTLGALTDRMRSRSILDACQALLVPGAIRSLADARTVYPLEIFHNGTAMGDPRYPYRGRYEGDENTDRKPAYHNGTAWTWLFPSYCEAYATVYGDNAIATARGLLLSSLEIIRRGCVGHIPEILDGDYPHTHRGCDAQAWGLSEWLRVWIDLKKYGRNAD